jgi:myosin heavy subunit
VIAWNPYEWLHELHSEETRNFYAQEPSEILDTIWNPMYMMWQLARQGRGMDGVDQSILVSGESGDRNAKTVKLCMKF